MAIPHLPYVPTENEFGDAFQLPGAKTRPPKKPKPKSLDLGGPGSGNFGHAGRPGEIGGSAPDGATTATNVGMTTSGEGRFGRTPADGPAGEWSRNAHWYDFGEAAFDTPSGDATPVASHPLKEIATALGKANHEGGAVGMAEFIDQLTPPAPEGFTKVVRIADRPGLKGNNAANPTGMTDYIDQTTDDGDLSIEWGFQLEDHPDLAIHTYYVKMTDPKPRYGGREGGGRGNFPYGR